MTPMIKANPFSLLDTVPKTHCRSKNWAPWLWVLLSLFAFRVFAQALLTRFDIPLLPNFDRWHSGAMPYWMLAMAQIVILLIMLWVTFRFSQNRVIANPRFGKFLAVLGFSYLTAMVVRLILGLTIYPESRWFTNWISTSFHIVLANYVLAVASYHLSHWIKSIRLQLVFPWLAYPAVMSGGITLHFALSNGQQHPLVSVYFPVLLGMVLVTLFEVVFPHNRSWQPDSAVVRNDLWFMGMIQGILPQVIAFLFILALVKPIQSLGWSLTFVWPQRLPLYAQALLMVLIADFFRYWLHRAAHKNRFLWRFHAVHHSPERLYWLNVGRFHPVDKTLQLFLDTLPFMLLGVSAEVINLYLVFYAINGFFQHSNIELRYGFLNYLISTSELHRWHHSRLPEESNSNYGNNLSIWDLLFDTWFLPKDRQVDDLGLENRTYPMDFMAQLKAPFISKLDTYS